MSADESGAEESVADESENIWNDESGAEETVRDEAGVEEPESK